MSSRTSLGVLLISYAAGASVHVAAQEPAVIDDLPGLGGAEATYIKASNAGAYERFGEAVAVSADGTTLAIAALQEDSGATGIGGDLDDFSAPNAGAVYIFTRSGSGWSQQAYLKASNTDASDRFGYSLALSDGGNTLAVGAMSEDSAATGVDGDQENDSLDNAGAVYIFTRQGGTWSQQAYIKASNTGGVDDGDQFGHDVALDATGDTLAVGAISEDSAGRGINGDQSDDSAAQSGAAYVFSRDGATWSQQAYLKPRAGTGHWDIQGVLFGYSVNFDASGDTLAVGAYNEDVNRGAIYVFTRSGETWTETARLTASNAEIGDALGTDVAVSADGNTIAAGAFDEDSALVGSPDAALGASDQPTDRAVGAVYVFERDDAGWSQAAFVKPTHASANQHFGWTLSLSADGDSLLVGAHFEDSAARGVNGDQLDASAIDAGSAYLYRRDGSTWAPIAYLKASNTAEFAEFGMAVAIDGDGDTLVIGAPREESGARGIGGEQEDNSAPESGAVYVY